MSKLAIVSAFATLLATSAFAGPQEATDWDKEVAIGFSKVEYNALVAIKNRVDSGKLTSVVLNTRRDCLLVAAVPYVNDNAPTCKPQQLADAESLASMSKLFNIADNSQYRLDAIGEKIDDSLPDELK